MEWDWKENNKQKTLFKSYHCSHCQQRKPCGVLNQEHCCFCVYQSAVAKAKEYSNYEKALLAKQKEEKARIQQLQLLKSYQCQECQAKVIDADFLYSKNKLVCWSCLMEKAGGATGEISFAGESQWYKKHWGINLWEGLENFSWLPVNKNCANKWLKDKEHLSNCDCLEKETHQLHELFTNSLKEKQERLAKCQCETSEKIRVKNDNYTWCESCEKAITAASKKRVIKNRNDPKFWGLEVKEKVLCGGCLKNLVEQMPVRKKYTFRKYEKRGYWQ